MEVVFSGVGLKMAENKGFGRIGDPGTAKSGWKQLFRLQIIVMGINVGFVPHQVINLFLDRVNPLVNFNLVACWPEYFTLITNGNNVSCEGCRLTTKQTWQ